MNLRETCQIKLNTKHMNTSMQIEETLVVHLLNQTEITDLISTKLHPVKFPQTTTYPCAVYFFTGTEEYQHHDNTGDAQTTNIDLDIFATTYSVTFSITEAFRLQLDGKSLSLTDRELHHISLETVAN